MQDLREIESQLREGGNIEDILDKQDWKSFEKVVSGVFEINGFSTRQNFRFKNKRRHEIDIIAIRTNRILCIDCKWWGRGRYKKSGLKQAVMKQENRAHEFEKFLENNPMARSILKLGKHYSVHSLLVTLHEEGLVFEQKTFLVPAWKLNQFLLEIERYI